VASRMKTEVKDEEYIHGEFEIPVKSIHMRTVLGFDISSG